MATQAQIQANRRNAERSTGPRTAEGKAVSSQNAVTHGLLAKDAVIRGEDPGEFEFYREQMLEELAPVGAMESMLAARIAGLAWRLQRAEHLQNEAFESMCLEEATYPFEKSIRARMSKALEGDPAAIDAGLVFGRVVVKDFSESKVLDRLGMYERRIEHSLYKTMAELAKLRLSRQSRSQKDGEQTAEQSRPVVRHRHLLSSAVCPAKLPSSVLGPRSSDHPMASLQMQNEPNCAEGWDGGGPESRDAGSGFEVGGSEARPLRPAAAGAATR